MTRRRLIASFSAAVLALAIAAIAYAQPPSGIVRPDNEASLSKLELGSQLYAGNCASCHGIAGAGVAKPAARGVGGVKGQGPPLKDVGAQSVDFYLRTGYMPLDHPWDQPWRKRVLFTPRELDGLIAYVASLGHGPPIPHPNPGAGNVSRGFHLFTEHCAGCHQSVAEGGYVVDARVPRLDKPTPTQIAEAVRTGPYLMPSFSRRNISDRQLNSIIAYIQTSKHPADRGGWGIGHIGPVPEGMVAWFIAALALIALCGIIGERLRT